MTEVRVPHEVVGFLIQGVLCNIRQQTKKQTVCGTVYGLLVE